MKINNHAAKPVSSSNFSDNFRTEINAHLNNPFQNKKAGLLSFSEAAKQLKIGKTNLWKLVSSGRLGYIDLGKSKKIPENELYNFISNETIRLEPEYAVDNSTKYSTKVSTLFDSVNLFNNLKGQL